jgi:uncharacterized protein YjbI with pentapeptide repeats
MTETLPEVYSDAWWQRVGPALSPDGRALVKENLTQAAATLGEEEREKFATALGALHAPSAEQRGWLRDVATVPNSGEILDLSNILICHPDTGAPIDFVNRPLPAVTFKRSVFAGEADFGQARLTGGVNFREATFAGPAKFLAVTFPGQVNANFSGATFTGPAHFLETTFTGEANFTEATFTGEVYFFGATFEGKANFEQTTFNGDAIFFNATFTGQAHFQNVMFMGKAFFWVATFAGEADFRQATFKDEASFHHARFKREAEFWGATFTGQANFEGARFTGEANFKHTEFLGMTIFGEARFTAVATFHAARFGKTVSFRGSDWGAVPDFKGTAWKDGVAVDDFEQLQTKLNKGELDWRQPSTSDSAPAPAPITDRLQALRKMARDADDRPRELDYFALELQARYQGKGAWAKRFLVSLYRRLSNYGRSIGRPLGWLAGLCLLSMLGYWVLADGDWSVLSKDRLFALTYGVLPDVDWSLWDNALLLSLVNALPPLGAGSGVRGSSLNALYCNDVSSLVGFIAVVEGVIGLILLFLIALGLRNRFRL